MDSYGRSRHLRLQRLLDELPKPSTAADEPVMKKKEPPSASSSTAVIASDPLPAIKRQRTALQTESKAMSSSSASSTVKPEDDPLPAIKRQWKALQAETAASESSDMDELLELYHLGQVKRRFEASKNKQETSESS